MGSPHKSEPGLNEYSCIKNEQSEYLESSAHFRQSCSGSLKNLKILPVDLYILEVIA